MKIQMKIQEKAIEKAIRRMIRDELGGTSIKLHGSPYQQVGLPDLVVIVAGGTAWLEVKRPGAGPTRIQALVHSQLRQHGAMVAVVHSVEEARQSLETCRSAKQANLSGGSNNESHL